MYEKFTEDARLTGSIARHEAALCKSDWIELDHFLLGLLLADTTLFMRVLPKANPSHLQSMLRKALPHANTQPVGLKDIPFANTVKNVLADALNESARCDHDHLGTAHLLHATMEAREHFSPGVMRVLTENGLTSESALRKIKIASSLSHKPYPSAEKISEISIALLRILSGQMGQQSYDFIASMIADMIREEKCTPEEGAVLMLFLE